jgi:hypothetical protein
VRAGRRSEARSFPCISDAAQLDVVHRLLQLRQQDVLLLAGIAADELEHPTYPGVIVVCLRVGALQVLE